jgi:aldehyde:ferredoxin oxidoreductase
MFGNTGRVIEVDLSAGTIEKKTLAEGLYKKYIGGSGLAAKLFWDRGNFTADPLSPEAMLIFMNGPFAGLKMSGASRNSVAGRSPLTGSWGDSSCGGYFAPELRYAGYDGIVITGKAANPSLILIVDDDVKIVDAAALWGKGIETANAELKGTYGKAARTVLIGPAGEAGVRFANVMNEAHHAFGRAGFGAVMGSKNLKGIVVKATKK